MTALIHYDAARKALAEACHIDQVRKIRDSAKAFEAYAREAKDCELMARALELSLIAERRAGELLIAMAESGERDKGAGGDRRSRSRDATVKTLAELGVTKSESAAWQRVARLGEEEFGEKLAATIGEAKRSLIATREERQVEKRERRAERERELGAKLCAWPTRRYGVIYCDPAWKFVTYSSETGLDRAADNHYPTQTLEEIAALDVQGIAADDCVLFMWVTGPFLRAAFPIMEGWGFEYKARFVWSKVIAGNGYWNRDDAEELLVGVRGSIPCPAPGTQFRALHEEIKARHSAKPDYFATMIEAMFPSLPKIELNRRGPPRTGWDAWGNEAEAEGAL
jgi:N6-adenosine-specific RNA methylase IME4